MALDRDEGLDDREARGRALSKEISDFLRNGQLDRARRDPVEILRSELERLHPIERYGGGMSDRSRDQPHSPKAGFEWNWNIATVLTGLVFAGSVFVAAITFNQRVSTLEQQQLEAATRALRYIPRIEALEAENRGQDAQNKVQDERIQNLARGLDDERKAKIEIMTKLSSIGEDLAAIRVKLQVERPGSQGGERR